MIRRLFILLFVTSWLIAIADAQGVQADLLRRVNSLRQSQGLSGYTPHAALNAAAANHAGWLARTGVNSHYQEDGAGPKSRAANAGYSSNWVSENYYFGLNATTERAWNFWLNSPGHYAGLVSPYYDNIGIAAASASGRTAYVLVFGNAAGRLANSNASTDASAESASRAAPSYVVGLDEFGNILHKVQSGDTLGRYRLDLRIYLGRYRLHAGDQRHDRGRHPRSATGQHLPGSAKRWHLHADAAIARTHTDSGHSHAGRDVDPLARRDPDSHPAHPNHENARWAGCAEHLRFAGRSAIGR